MSPDPDFVREWIDLAARTAGMGAISEEFAERVQRRLEKGAAEYGADNYLRASPSWLAEQTAEEGDDIAAWAAVLTARIYRDLAAGAIDDAAASRAQQHLLRAAAWGLHAWIEVQAARELLPD